MNKCLIILFLIISLIISIGLIDMIDIAVAGPLDKDICPCSEAVYLFRLEGSQDSVEEYSFSVDKFARQTMFSENPAFVYPGETKIVYAYITPECDLVGDYEFNFIIKNKGNKMKFPASLNIDLCFDFAVDFGELLEADEKLEFNRHEGAYQVCGGDIKRIPVLIINKGNLSNNFFFELEGDFAELSQRSAVLKENQKGVIYLDLEPGGIGEYSLFLDVTRERGNVKKSYKIDFEVEDCYKVVVDIEKEQDSICSGERTDYDVEINNEGVFDESFVLSTDIDWAGFDNNVVEIKAEEKRIARLSLDPLISDSGRYDVNVKAGIEGTNIEAGDSIRVRVIPKESCYSAKVIANSRYSFDYLGERIAIKIKNNGIKEADFGISLVGPDWVSINQDKVHLIQGDTKILNIVANPSEGIEVGTYDLNVTLTKDELAYSKSITLELSKRGEIFSRIKFYFNYYIYYFITGVILLILALVLITLARWTIKKIPEKTKKKKKVEIKNNKKKIESIKLLIKKVNWIQFFKIGGIILAALVFLSVIGYLFYRLKLFDYIKSYLVFIGAGFGLLVILILVIHFKRKGPKKKKIEKIKEKPKKKEIKKIEKEIERAKPEIKKEKSHIIEFIEYTIILIILGAVVYFISRIEGIESTILYYLNFVILGFSVLVILVMIINKFRKLKERRKKKVKRDIKKEEKIVAKKEAKKVRRKMVSKSKYFKYLFLLVIAVILGLYILSFSFYGFVTSFLSVPYTYIKDFILLYYKYIIAGFVILVVLVLLLKYYRKFFDFIMEEDDEKEK